MKWFFCLTDQDMSFLPYVKAAVNSALKNTTLDPYCVFDGSECEITEWLRSKNIPVIFHVPFYRSHFDLFADQILSNLNKIHTPKLSKPFLLSAYLRMEIPEIVRNVLTFEDTHALYTDVDLIFINQIDENLLKPVKSISASATDQFNSGVMSFNIDRMIEKMDVFKFYVKHKGFLFQFCDQGAFQNFYTKYNDECEKFTINYNWRAIGLPFNPSASIIHYSGLKPTKHYDMILNDNFSFVDVFKPETRERIISHCRKFRDDVEKNCDLWKEYAV